MNDVPWLEWYQSLAKPSWTPAPGTIGLIWQVLYPVIIATFCFVFVQAGRGKIPWLVALPFTINLTANLVFTPTQFSLRNLPLASLDIVVGKTRAISAAILLALSSRVATEEALRPLLDFAGPEAAQQWQAVNDGVMGGVSDGRFKITDAGTLEFSGTLSLENNGGFASVRTSARVAGESGPGPIHAGRDGPRCAEPVPVSGVEARRRPRSTRRLALPLGNRGYHVGPRELGKRSAGMQMHVVVERKAEAVQTRRRHQGHRRTNRLRSAKRLRKYH
jgi:hypothetical protein